MVKPLTAILLYYQESAERGHGDRPDGPSFPRGARGHDDGPR